MRNFAAMSLYTLRELPSLLTSALLFDKLIVSLIELKVMRAMARAVRLSSSIVRATTFRYCSVGSSSSPSTPTDSFDVFDEFVHSIGRDVTDMNKVRSSMAKLWLSRLFTGIATEVTINILP